MSAPTDEPPFNSDGDDDMAEWSDDYRAIQAAEHGYDPDA